MEETRKLTKNDSLDEVCIDDVSLNFSQTDTKKKFLTNENHQELNKTQSSLLPDRKKVSYSLRTMNSLARIHENKPLQPPPSSSKTFQPTISNKLPSIPKRKVSLVNLNKYGDANTAVTNNEVFKRPVTNYKGDEGVPTGLASLSNRKLPHVNRKDSVLAFARPMEAKRATKANEARGRWIRLRQHLFPNQQKKMRLMEAVRLAQAYEKAKKGIAAKEINTKKQSDNLMDKTNKRKVGVVLLACMVEADLPNDFYDIVSLSGQLDKIMKSFAGVSPDARELLGNLCRESVDQMTFQEVLSEVAVAQNNNNNNSNQNNADNNRLDYNTWLSNDSVFTRD